MMASWDNDDLEHIGHHLPVYLSHGGLTPGPEPGHAAVDRLRMAMRRPGRLAEAQQELCEFR